MIKKYDQLTIFNVFVATRIDIFKIIFKRSDVVKKLNAERLNLTKTRQCNFNRSKVSFLQQIVKIKFR